MTARDRMIVVVVLVVAMLGGVWFVALAPKRKQATELQGKIDVANQQLSDAQQKAATARKAKAGYNEDYATVATLGKAVPKSDALASLLYQLQSTAHGARIDFNSLKINGSGAPTTPSTPAANAAAATNAANGTTPAAPSTSSATPSTSTPATSGSSGTAASPAPATAAAAATLPPGAVVGSAGFPTMPFSFVFSGTFFDMEKFLGDVQRFVRVNGDKVDVRGRLLSVDGFSLSAGPGGFPNVKASINATAYLRSPSDDVVPTDSSVGATGSAAAAASTTTPTTTAAGAPQ